MEDYYHILGISSQSSQEEIKKAYRVRAFIYHTDHMAGLPESARQIATEEMKKLNEAYEILGDPEKRQMYDLERLRNKGTKRPSGNDKVLRPKPVVEPPFIRFNNVPASTVKTGSFIVRNEAGPYSKIWISDPKPWVTITNFMPLNDPDKLPLKIKFEAEGKDWGKTYLETIIIRLDNEETHVKIELRTQNEPIINTSHISTVSQASYKSSLVQFVSSLKITTSKHISAMRLKISSWSKKIPDIFTENFLGIAYFVLCIPIAYGSILLMKSVETYSFIWCLALLVFIACLPGLICIIIWLFVAVVIIAVVVLILWLIISLIQHFIQHPW